MSAPASQTTVTSARSPGLGAIRSVLEAGPVTRCWRPDVAVGLVFDPGAGVTLRAGNAPLRNGRFIRDGAGVRPRGGGLSAAPISIHVLDGENLAGERPEGREARPLPRHSAARRKT